MRYISLDKGAPALRVAPPLRMLAMVSSPTDYPPLDVEAEWARLDEGLADLVGQGMVEIHRMERATLRELQRTLRRQDFHLFHFIGHGGFDEAADDGVLMLETEEGRAREVSGRQLGTILDDARTIRVAVLNACEGARASGTDPFAGVAQSLVARGIPAVVAMQFEITDRAAIVFAHEFYASVADGMAVEGAVGEARRAIFGTKSDVEWGTAVLYMRAEDGRLFDLTEPTLVMEQPVEMEPVVGEASVVAEEPPAETPVETAFLDVAETRNDPEPLQAPPSDIDTVVTDLPAEEEKTEPERSIWDTGDEVVEKVTGYATGFVKIAAMVVAGIVGLVFVVFFIQAAVGGGGGDTTVPTTGSGNNVVDSATVTMVPVSGVTIDGDLSDWAEHPTANELSHPVRDDLVENRLGSDSSAVVSVGYDSAAMYLAVEVDDDVYSQENDGNQIWRGDAVDINLFAGPEGDVPTRPDSRTYQLTMTPENIAGRPSLVLFTGNGSGFSDNTTSVPVDVAGEVNGDGDWRLEARIPWSVFGLQGPTALSSALFAVFDNDGETANGRSLQAEILANRGGVFFQQPQTWGTLARE